MSGGVPWVWTDGGRAAAGYGTGTDARDCVARAMAVAMALDYREAYEMLATRSQELGFGRTARDGVPSSVYKTLWSDLAWVWRPTMHIGSGTTVHLRVGEIPDEGRAIVRLSRHLTALVDGVVWDNHDPSRGGTRCVYGFWTPPPVPLEVRVT